MAYDASERMSSSDPATPATQVFAVLGVDPEVNAYAMAKYSRSALSMRDSLAEIDAQRAEKFLNTFYFEYGHRSIADLAHISFAVERLSMLAAIELADETRWDGQERSTRYQEFRRTGWYTPPGLEGTARAAYDAAAEHLFSAYEALSEASFQHLTATVERPATLKPEAYQRTLRARAFDVGRYLLPLATITSLGQIVSARTLEQQVVRLLSSPFAEVRELGAALKRAATEPAFDLRQIRAQHLVEGLRQAGADPALIAEAELLARPVKASPTLVKYTDPSPYQLETRRALQAAAGELLGGLAPQPGPAVDLLDDEPLEVEIAASLLYPACDLPYRQVRAVVAALGAPRRAEIIALGWAHRGPHDEMRREFQAGAGLRFDILMDIGGFRDLHRHRRCVQLHQACSFVHGFEEPEMVAACGAAPAYRAAMAAARAAATALPDPLLAPYLLPMGFRKRTLFKMDFAQAAYIAELRTAPAGHFSYRRIAWEMFLALRRRHPELTGTLRVTDPALPVDLLQR